MSASMQMSKSEQRREDLSFEGATVNVRRVSNWKICEVEFKKGRFPEPVRVAEVEKILDGIGKGCDVVLYFMGEGAVTDGSLDRIIPELINRVQGTGAKVSLKMGVRDFKAFEYLYDIGAVEQTTGGILHSEFRNDIDEMVHSGGLGAGSGATPASNQAKCG